MYVTTKSTLYLIDGLNLVRSFLYEFARSEEESADQIIYERAAYAAQTGQRVVAVTDDRQLQADLKKLGVKTLFCRKFYNNLKISEK